MTSGPGVAITLVGIVGLLVGVAGAFGFIPGLQLVQTPCGNLSTSYTYTTSGLTVTVTDTSTMPSGPEWKTLPGGFDFNGSGAETNVAPGATHSYNYTQAGTYSVTDDQGGACYNSERGQNAYFSSTSTQPVTVTGSGGGGGGGGANATVHAKFSLTAVDLKAFLNDTSTINGNPSLTLVAVGWGDGESASPGALGFSVNHDYAKTGNYNVTETVKWTSNGTPGQSTFSESIDLTTNSTTTTNVTHAFVFNAITGFLIIGFGAMACLGFVAVRFPTYGALAIGVAMVLGLSAGFGIGGW